MIQLSKTEEKELSKKIKILEEFNNTFTDATARLSDILRAFTGREIGSQLFLDSWDNFIAKLIGGKSSPSSIINIFYYLAYNLKDPNYQEITLSILDRVPEFKGSYSSGKHYEAERCSELMTSLFNICLNNYCSAEDGIDIIVKNKLIESAHTNGIDIQYSRFLSLIISRFQISDSDKFIEKLESVPTEQSMLPLLITNESLSKDKKVAILKKAYRQKDLPRYRDFIKNSMKNIDDLDVFIEATILQNNRVREKNDNIIKIFKDFFVDGESYECKILKNIDINSESTEKFRKKYKIYFEDKVFIKKFFNTINSIQTYAYRRSSQYAHLIKFMFKDIDIKDALQKAKEGSEYSCLTENLKMLFDEAEAKGDIDSVKLIIEVAIERAYNKNNDMIATNVFFNSILNNRDEAEANELLDKYLWTGAFDKWLSNLTLFINYNTYESNLTDPSIGSYYNRIFRKSLIKSSKKELFMKMKIMTDEDTVYLGLPYEKVESMNNNNYYSSSFGNMLRACHFLYKELYERFTASDEDTDIEVRKFIYNKFFAIFKDTENVNKLTENLIKFSNSKSFSKFSINYGTSQNTVEFFIKEVIGKMSSIYIPDMLDYLITNDPENADEYKESKTVIQDNFKELYETINLLCQVMC